MFLTHDSYFKSALKYSKSLGNQQGDLQWKIAKKNPKKPFQVSFVMFGFFGAKPAGQGSGILFFEPWVKSYVHFKCS